MYLIGILKKVGGQISLAKTLNKKMLTKAVAVKLVNKGFISVASNSNVSILKKSDVKVMKEL